MTARGEPSPWLIELRLFKIELWLFKRAVSVNRIRGTCMARVRPCVISTSPLSKLITAVVGIHIK